MYIKLTEKEALALYRIILRWDETNLITTQDKEEQQLLWGFTLYIGERTGASR